MTVKVTINGFGRIDRNIFRAIVESGRDDIEVVAINDLGPVEANAHLMRYDSVHGRFPGTVSVSGDTIDVGGIKAVDLDGEYLGSHQAFWFAWSQFYLKTKLWNG